VLGQADARRNAFEKIEEAKMRTAFVAAVCSALIGVGLASSPAFSQQKTVKACQDEWRANKAGNQAKGITEKAYVEQCRAGVAPAAATPGTAPASPTTTPATPPSAPATPPPARAAKQTPAPAPTGSDQFTTEALARSHCPADTVVWANLKSKIYHFASYKNYGTTKDGAYMCETDANKQGFRASKTEKPPA
jgi:hypothetical protein